MKTNVKLFLMLIIIFLPTFSFSAITFDANGKWETTFDCAEQEQRVVSGDPELVCDDMTWAGSWTAQPGNVKTTITSAANNPDGLGARGARFWKGSVNTNDISGTIRVTFSESQPEVWIRWYQRYESGFEWKLGPAHTKDFYIRDGVATSPYIGHQGTTRGGVNTSTYRIYHANLGWYDTGPDDKGGWYDIYPTGTSDGTWHLYETYLKMDSPAGNDGVWRMWVNGELAANHEGLDFGSPATGWLYFDFLENNQRTGLERPYYVDFDDMVIYNTTPPNVDPVHGIPWIGPVGWNGGAASLPPPPAETPSPVDPVTGLTKGALVMSESFENNNWSARGWYDGTNSTGTTAGGYQGNALNWTWVTGNTNPTGFSTIRRILAQSFDEFIIEYYVKHGTGWVGSGVNYHPHLIHIVSTEDWAVNGYGPMAGNHSNLYFESLVNGGVNYPQIAHQDRERAVSSRSDLTGVTETRSANDCDTPRALSGATSGTCYSSGGGWYSANTWRSSTVNIPAGEWVKITSHVKKNTFTAGIGNFDGILRVWVNDALAIESTSVMYAAGTYADTEWNKIALAPYMQPGNGSPANQTMWLDELSVWTVTGGSGSSEVLPPPMHFRQVQ